MKVSLNWVRHIDDRYGCAPEPAPDGIKELKARVGTQLGAIEETIDVGKKYHGLVVVKVESCEKHPNADKLSFCLVDDGGVNKSVKRDAKGLIEIVCGAPNVKAGQLAVWIPPGATVPSSHDKEPFIIEARDIRGKMSNGMLASPKELALADSHEGILVLEAGKPGDDFAALAGLDDYVIDIENKMFTHRPDLFGILGVAREIAGIQGQAFKSPSWYREDAGLSADGRKNVLKLEVRNELPDMIPRFCVVAIKDVKIAPSPLWLQVRLASAGIRPINNIVDITNFYMHETGQPLHAYDYDKLKTGVIGVRWGKKGEKLNLLNGKTITIEHKAVVITDGQEPIGLGGVMGGADTEVDETTKSIVLEAANFDMNTTRRTAMAYGLFTDAATRFTKNQSPRQNLAVMVKAVEGIQRVAGGRVASPIIDDNHVKKAAKPIVISAAFVNSRLGVELTAAQIKKILENVEFGVELKGDELKVTSPFWRTDIEIPEDLVEEAGRLYGYDKLPQVLPRRSIEPPQRNGLMAFKDKVRELLSAGGANEVLTYSFVHTNLLAKVNEEPAKAYKLSNASSPSIEYYRFNLIPSLLDKVHPSVKAGYERFALYEIGTGHDKQHQDDDGLPLEFMLLSLVYTESAKSKTAGAAYYKAKSFLDGLAAELGVNLSYTLVEKFPQAPLAQAYAPGRTAMVSTDKGDYLGIIGEFKSSVRRQLKLSDQTAGFEIDISALYTASPSVKPYQPLPRFPETSQDLCLRTTKELNYGALTAFLSDRLNESSKKDGYGFRVELLDIYAPDNQHFKQTTWRIHLWHPRKTLTTQETNQLMDSIADAAKKELKAERI